MELKKLATLTFDKNVGTRDRIFRLLSGAALIGAGWYMASLLFLVLGAMWTATGVLSRCSVYYLLGYSTCPLQQTKL